MTIKALLAGMGILASVAVITLGPAVASTTEAAPVTFGAATRVAMPPVGSAGRLPSAEGRLWTLQLNLCNSGEAGCYAGGKAIGEAATLIRRLRPNLVTLNEICVNDLPVLLSSLATAWPGDWTYHVFMPAIDKRTNAPYRCQNGHEFGNAVLGQVPAASYRGVNGWGGRYAGQDRSTEDRTFACAYAVGNHLACATHLSSHGKPIALTQCRALLLDAIPHIRSTEGFAGPTIIGGDLNLGAGPADSDRLRTCVPAGHARQTDGDVQHVIFSDNLTVTGADRHPLTHTDHDGLLVTLTTP